MPRHEDSLVRRYYRNKAIEKLVSKVLKKPAPKDKSETVKEVKEEVKEVETKVETKKVETKVEVVLPDFQNLKKKEICALIKEDFGETVGVNDYNKTNLVAYYKELAGV